MKIKLAGDDYFHEESDADYEVEFTDEEYARFKEAMDRFEYWQGKIRQKIRSKT